MVELIDFRTAKFAWDPIFDDYYQGMKGKLTGFLVTIFFIKINSRSYFNLKKIDSVF